MPVAWAVSPLTRYPASLARVSGCRAGTARAGCGHLETVCLSGLDSEGAAVVTASGEISAGHLGAGHGCSAGATMRAFICAHLLPPDRGRGEVHLRACHPQPRRRASLIPDLTAALATQWQGR